MDEEGPATLDGFAGALSQNLAEVLTQLQADINGFQNVDDLLKKYEMWLSRYCDSPQEAAWQTVNSPETLRICRNYMDTNTS